MSLKGQSDVQTSPLATSDASSRYVALQRTVLIDRLLSDPSPIQLLLAAPGFGATTSMRQCADRWGRNAPVLWIDLRPDEEGDRLATSIAHTGASHLVCIDAPDGLSNDQTKEVAALLLRGARPRLMIASHENTLTDRLPCDYALFGAESLRFSESEIASLLKDHEGLAQDVVDSAQGWPFALDMLRKSTGHPQVCMMSNLVKDVPCISQYFETVVLPRLTQDSVDVLCVIAILNSNFSVDLATWLTEDRQAWYKIETAVVSELFITSVRDRSNIYRLHPLFAAFLRNKAEASTNVDRKYILHRACDWFRRKGRWDRAIHYASQADDSLTIIEIARQAGGWKMLGGGGLQSVGEALDALPEQSATLDPQVRALRIVSALKAGKGYQKIRFSEDRLLYFLIGFYQDRLRGNRWLRRLYQVRDEIGTADCVTYAVLSSLICLKHLDSGALDSCDSEAQRAIEVLLRADHPSGTAYLQSYLARADTMRGNLDAADAHVGRVFAIAWEPLVEVEPLAQLACVHAATIALERGDTAKGRRLMTPGWQFLRSLDGWFDVLAEAVATSVRLALNDQDTMEAFRVLKQAEIVADRRSLLRLKLVIAGWRMVAAVAAKSADAVRGARSDLDALHKERTRGSRDSGHYLAEAHAFAETSYAAWRGEPECALDLMMREAHRASKIGALPLHRRALMWAALAAEQNGERATAEELINQRVADFPNAATLSIALPLYGNLRPLLCEMARAGRLKGAVAETVHELVDDTEDMSADSVSEWLSVREEQILDLVGAGMTNKEIARRLAISDSTVKFHRKNIYAKLGVNRRSRALELLKQRRAWSLCSPISSSI